MPRSLLLAVFFLSGASALVFEILWTRMAGLVFGSTLQAVSTVLAAFMAGLALGGLAFGRAADRVRNPLLLYAGMELLAGLLGAAVSLALPSLAGLAAWLEAGGFPQAAGVGLRFLAILLLVLAPTLLMGGTLPVLTRHLTRRGGGVGASVAALYAANTLGAVVGCLATDFLLVHHLGMRATVLLAAATYVLLAGVVLPWARAEEPAQRADRGPDAADEDSVPGSVLRLVVCLAGTCALAYEVVWTRLLLFFNGSDVYVFSLMLGTYLLGMGLGSAVLGRILDRLRHPARILAAVQLAVALTALLPLVTVRLLAPLYQVFQASLGSVAGWENLYRLAVTAVVVLPPTLFVGMTFPLANRIAVRNDASLGRQVGGVYFWSTVGSIAGSLLGGFWLLPSLGVQASLATLAAGNLAAATLLLLATRRPWAACLPALLAAGLLFLPQGLLLRSTYGARFPSILQLGEDLYGSLAVVETADPAQGEKFRVLVVNGYSMTATNFHARRYMKLLSHLPLLLADRRERILVVCFGTGQTLGAASLHRSLQDLDCAELSREVPRLAHFFEGPNLGVLRDPRVQLEIQDGRTHIQSVEGRYDVITAEPPPPHNAGVVNLYTRDFYRLCARALRPGGVVCQWLPVYQMSPQDTRAAIRAMQEVFPEISLWAGYREDLCLVGRKEGGAPDFPEVARRMQEARVCKDLASIGVASPEDLLAQFLLGSRDLAAYAARTRPLTDDRPDMQYGLLTGQIDISGLFGRSSSIEAAPVAGIPPGVAARAEAQRSLFLGLAYAPGRRSLVELLRETTELRRLFASTPSPEYYQHALGCTPALLDYHLAQVGTRPDSLLPAAQIALLLDRPGTVRSVLEAHPERVAADVRLQILLGAARLRLGDPAGRADLERATARNPEAGRLAEALARP